MGTDERSLEVLVAATEDPLRIFEIPAGGPPANAAWSELPKTRLLVTPTETLREVLTRAATDLGISVGAQAARIINKQREEQGKPPTAVEVVDRLAFAEFRRLDDDEHDEHGRPRRIVRLKSTGVAVVRDPQGHAIWKRPPFEATMAELVDAAETGLLDGDPLQPYLVLLIPQGELGGPLAWHQLAQQLKLLWDISGYLAQAGGAWAFIELVRQVARRRSKETVSAIESNATTWTDRGARPGDLLDLVQRAPRTAQDIAALLGCSEQEAEAILWGIGCTHIDGIWIYRGDAAASFIADDLELRDSFSAYRDPEATRPEFERRLTELGQHGSAPSAEEEKREMHEEFTQQVERELAQEPDEDFGAGNFPAS